MRAGRLAQALTDCPAFRFAASICCHMREDGMNSVETLLPTLRALAEAMITLRGHVSFNEEQNAALERACELIVLMEVGGDVKKEP